MSGMITAAEPIAVEEGAKVHMAGGNAVGGGLARVHAVAIEPDSRALTGAADTGGAGMALAV